MKLLTGHTNQCLLWSAAMVLDEKPSTLLKEIGYTGNEIWWPDKPRPYCFRGHHIQEIVDVAFCRNVALVPIQLYPNLNSDRRLITEDKPLLQARFKGYITGQPAILIGAVHAVAWDGQQVYDPNGSVYSILKFTIREAWIAVSIK